MEPQQWVSLGLHPAEHPEFETGKYKTIEAADNKIIGIRKGGQHQTVLGQVKFREEAVVVATILRMFNPD